MTSLIYIIHSVPWTVFGLLLGFFAGRSTAAAVTITEQAPEGVSMPDRPPRRAWWRRFTTIHMIGLVLVILGISTAIQGHVQGERTERLQECTTAYSNGFADVIEARSKASAESQDALDEFLSAVSKATPTQEGRELVRKALDTYISKRATAKKAQAEHPYPDPPRDVC